MRLVNISDIANYVVCPKKTYYKLVLGKREKINRAMIFGRIKHEFMEKLNKSDRIVFSSIKQGEKFNNIETRFEQKYNEILNDMIKKHKTIIEKFSLKRYIEQELNRIKNEEKRIKAKLANKFVRVGFYGPELWEVITPKFISEIEIKSYVLGLKGRVDRIKIDHEGIFPYEIKSRQYGNKIWLSEKLQLTGYALLLERKFKTNIDYGFLKFKDKVIKINIINSLREKLIILKEEILEMIKNRTLPKEKQKHSCKICNNLEFY